ncbi:NAD(P) transhydrogenase subunit alpha [Flammeovirgaceae bacterium SG7u.111]|nr:NAD(P) transhydrogenase subunit alpha [Flammeovirgaceae bacterium SG7u.132]WPO36510.1 NAD(P) transhydrogenase subunit alpha [Flammeovirgaceae bacterium SG7u.111]
MLIGILKEQDDARVSIVPEIAAKFIGEGNEALVEKGAGELSYFSDAAYEEAGVKAVAREEVLSKANFIVSIHPLTEAEIASTPEDAVIVSSFQPYAQPEVATSLAQKSRTVFSLDMIPRTTLAQSMDVLSSMASISGYQAVVKAATILPRYFPMLSTAAGTIPPAKVLVIGAGVAGLQAIATAKRLGTVIEAFDTRAAAKEEVQSLGAKFVEVEGAKDDTSAGGYAVEQTEEYKQKQAALIAEKAEKADVIITTALLRGKKAPVIIGKDILDKMKPGSVIMDLASAGGGNTAVTEDKKTVVYNHVTVVGDSNLAAEVPSHASQLYSKNLQNFFKIFLIEGKVDPDFENEIIASSCIVYNGEDKYNKVVVA